VSKVKARFRPKLTTSRALTAHKTKQRSIWPQYWTNTTPSNINLWLVVSVPRPPGYDPEASNSRAVRVRLCVCRWRESAFYVHISWMTGDISMRLNTVSYWQFTWHRWRCEGHRFKGQCHRKHFRKMHFHNIIHHLVNDVYPEIMNGRRQSTVRRPLVVKGSLRQHSVSSRTVNCSCSIFVITPP